MNYPIPSSPQEMLALRQQPIDEAVVAAAIAGVVRIAQLQGRSLEELRAEVLADDSLLNSDLRRWLSDVVSQTWKQSGVDS